MIEFKLVSSNDYDRLFKWLNTGKVLKWFGLNKLISKEDIAKKYSVTSDPKTKNYMIINNDEPVGFIKTYLIRDYPDYFKYLGLDDNPAGFDIFIADEFRGKGLGVKAIKKFINKIIFSNPDIKRIIIGPEESNLNAIKTYEKAGFKFLKLVSIPDEKEREYLMELNKNT